VKKSRVSLSPYLSSEALLALFHESHDPVYVLTLEGGFIEANAALFEYVGYSRDELLATGFGPTVADVNGDYVREQFRRAAHGETTRYVAAVRKRDGTIARAQVINAPLFENGEPVAVLGIARDLGESERAEKAQELEQLLEATLNSISDGLYLLDRDWVFTYVNPRGEEIAQRSKEELLGNTIWDMFPLMIGSEFGIGYRRAMTEQTKVVVQEKYEPYGVILEATAYPTLDGIAIYVSDVTEEQTAR
jgi:PAS domain S-box-containing protein